MNIGETIKTIRKEKKISRGRLAAMTGLSVNALYNIETNRSMPTRDTIRRICKALSIPTYYLMVRCVTEDDIPEEKREVFRALYPLLIKIAED